MNRPEAKARMQAVVPKLMEHGAPPHDCMNALGALRANSPVLHLRLYNVLRALPPNHTTPPDVLREAFRVYR